MSDEQSTIGTAQNVKLRVRARIVSVNDADENSTWTLEIVDVIQRDGKKLYGYEVILETPESNATISDASRDNILTALSSNSIQNLAGRRLFVYCPEQRIEVFTSQKMGMREILVLILAGNAVFTFILERQEHGIQLIAVERE